MTKITFPVFEFLIAFLVGLFATCKVLGIYEMSWLWVFAPFWIPVLGLIAFIIIMFIIVFIVELIS